MSSILKALKKVEEEKAARLSGQTDISRAILPDRTSQNRRRPSMPVIGGVLLLALLILGVSVTLLRSRGTSTRMDAPRHPAQPAPAVAPPSTPPVAGPSIPAPPSPAPLVTREPASVQPPPLPMPRQQSPRPTSPQPLQTPPEPFSRPLPLPTATPQTPAETTARPAPVPASPQPHGVPTLRVSGIAWQKDSASRLAIVNGQPVGLGAAVSGATVDEIFPDLVRFSYKGEKIEVGLGKSSKDN